MFPFYLAIGMSADEYWHQDVWLAQSYLKAHKMRNEMESQKAWLQGLYIHNAVAVAIANAFRKQGSPPQSYMEKPFQLYKPEQTKEEKIQAIREQVAAELTKFGKDWKAQHEAMKSEANNG